MIVYLIYAYFLIGAFCAGAAFEDDSQHWSWMVFVMFGIGPILTLYVYVRDKVRQLLNYFQIAFFLSWLWNKKEFAGMKPERLVFINSAVPQRGYFYGKAIKLINKINNYNYEIQSTGK